MQPTELPCTIAQNLNWLLCDTKGDYASLLISQHVRKQMWKPKGTAKQIVTNRFVQVCQQRWLLQHLHNNIDFSMVDVREPDTIQNLI